MNVHGPVRCCDEVINVEPLFNLVSPCGLVMRQQEVVRVGPAAGCWVGRRPAASDTAASGCRVVNI